MLDGLTTGTPASLVIGIITAAAPELNGPMIASAESSCATRRLLATTRSGVQLPACRVASLSVTSAIGCPPAIPPACCSAWRAPSLIARPCAAAAPLSVSEE